MDASTPFLAELEADLDQEGCMPWAAKSAGTRSDPRVSDATVLLIEDDHDVNRLIATRLRADGLRVLSSTDGEEGLRLAIARRPSMIILDLLLPSVSGFGVLHFLRSLPSVRRIPVVVLTGLSGAGTEAAAREWGNVLRFVRKPINARAISQVVREVLNLPGAA